MRISDLLHFRVFNLRTMCFVMAKRSMIVTSKG